MVSRWPVLHLQTAPVSLFLCAVMVTAWLGGAGPGLVAIALSSLAFLYYFLPSHSLVPEPGDIPRAAAFLLAALFVGSLSAAQRSATESLRRARDELTGTVQELQRTNDALQTESSERKLAEEALRQAQADLARINRATTAGELTASLAHEVNQPIAAAVTNANTCLRWLTRQEPDLVEAREAASRVMKDATRAADIISRVRLLFKKGDPKRELVDVNDIISEMIVLLGSEASRYAILVQARLAEVPKVLGDRVQLQQVVMNLVMNSIDAMKGVDGTRELAITSQCAENGRMLVSITDTGIGLPVQEADQIFKPFFTTKPHGIGMGLSISRSIIESHGGRLWAANDASHGASFHLTLPTADESHE
jgi:C4-dicarboxylate-specific signal transduction histidine kinase